MNNSKTLKKQDSQQVFCETSGLKRYFVKDAKIDTFVGDESHFECHS